MRTSIRALAFVIATVALPGVPAWAQGAYRLESADVLAGPQPDWDYLALDPKGERLFIGRRAAGLLVFDVAAHKAIRTIENSADAGAVVLVPALDRGFTANGDGSTTVFELSTLRSLQRIRFGEDSDAVFFEPASGQLVFTSGDSHRIVFLDARTGRQTGEIAMDSSKLDGTVADGEGGLYVALRDRNSVARIDAKQHALRALWPTAPCEQPTGIAFDAKGRRLFVGCRGRAPLLAVLDAETGRVIATKDIGRGNDGVVFDAQTRRIYTSNGVDANLVIYEQVDADTYRLQQASTTRPSARTMALDPRTGKVYLVTAEGTVDPAKKINSAVATFYPNRYFDDTFTVLTYAPR